MKNFNKKSRGPAHRQKGPVCRQAGQVVMMTVVCFLIVSLAVISAVVVPTANQIKSVRDLHKAKQGYLAADSVNEEAFYRLNQGQTLPATLTLPFSSGITAEAEVATVGDTKQITTTGTNGETIRYAKSVLSVGIGVAFSYGVQIGTGGVQMDNGSDITGNVYANGSIVGGSGSANNKVITGSAIAANSADSTPNTENNNPIDSPTDSITFGKVFATAADFAQSFQVTGNSPIHSVSFFIKKVGAPLSATVRIMSNSGSSPGSNLLSTQGTLTAANVIENTYGWVDVVLPSNPTLNAGTTYWIVIDTPITVDKPNDYYVIAANNSIYSSGVAKVGKNTSWNATSPSTLDSYFKLYSGGTYSTISDVKVGLSSADSAWAHTISGISGSATRYCPASPCDTSRDDPSPTGFPISDGNIIAWQAEAVAGGVYTGNVTLGEDDTRGAEKIVGNLHVDPGSDNFAYMTGTLWVTGNLTVDNGGTFKLASGYGSNSGVIVVDGTVTINNGGDLVGTGVLTNGKETSFIMVVSTSASDYAVDINNNGGAVVINAQKGTVRLSNNADLNQVTAKKLYLAENSHVTYKDGLANQNFASGPSGAWTVDSWGEVSQ